MCGKETESLMVASVEGVELSVCSNCAKFGKIVRKAAPRIEKEQERFVKAAPQRERIIQIITPDYNTLIKNARERLGLAQEDFAKKINEKVSLIQHIESGKTEPSTSLARKIEKFLNIKLIEQHEEKHETIKGKLSEGFTIGDFIKTKR
jgi:putative transcription factor